MKLQSAHFRNILRIIDELSDCEIPKSRGPNREKYLLLVGVQGSVHLRTS